MLNRVNVLLVPSFVLCLCVAPSYVSAQDAATTTTEKPKAVEIVKLESAEPLAGEWKFVSVTRSGKDSSEERLKAKVVVTKDKLTLKSDDGDFEMKYELDATKSPAQVKFTITASPFGGEGVSTSGILQMTSDDRLHLCYAEVGANAPTKFASPEGATERYIVLQRIETK